MKPARQLPALRCIEIDAAARAINLVRALLTHFLCQIRTKSAEVLIELNYISANHKKATKMQRQIYRNSCEYQLCGKMSMRQTTVDFAVSINYNKGKTVIQSGDTA